MLEQIKIHIYSNTIFKKLCNKGSWFCSGRTLRVLEIACYIFPVLSSCNSPLFSLVSSYISVVFLIFEVFCAAFLFHYISLLLNLHVYLSMLSWYCLLLFSIYFKAMMESTLQATAVSVSLYLLQSLVETSFKNKTTKTGFHWHLWDACPFTSSFTDIWQMRTLQ